jgi:hypothetical protein
MPPPEQKGIGASGTLLEIWNKPVVRYFAAALAAVAAVVKILQFFVAPNVSSTVKLTVWGVFLLAMFPFVAQGVVSGANRLVESAIEKQMRQGNFPVPSEEVAGEVAYVFNSQLYGMAYEELITHCTIHKDGSAGFRREVELVAHSVVSKIELYMLLPEATPTGDDQLELAGAVSLTHFRKLTSEVNRLSSGQMSLTVSISPELNSGQRLRYQVVEKSSPGLYAVTGREERKMPYDYFAWDITRPTKKLEMKVFFPEDVRPEAFEPDVWHALGQGQSTHSREYDRVKELLVERQEGLFHTLVFTIPYPILGLTYVIRWTPPRAM